jgi:quercetin dioxygenase-like cupin family protein
VSRKATMRIFRATEGRVLPDESGDVGMEILPMSQSSQDGFARLIDAGLTDGNLVKILFEAPGFSLAYVWFKPHFPLPRHSHKQDCLYHIVEGSIRLGKEWLGAGDGFFLPSGTPYTYAIGAEGVQMLEIRHCGEIDYRSFGHTAAWWDKAEKAIRDNHAAWQKIAPPRPALSA